MGCGLPVDFRNQSEDRQLAAVSELTTNVVLDERGIDVVLSLLRDRNLSVTVRNNLANVLLLQEQRDPRWSVIFAAMTQDPNETSLWQEYALQHLATTAQFSLHPDRIANDLLNVARTGRGTLPGTALLHLDRLESGGLMRLGPDYQTLLATRLADPTTDLQVKMTIVGLIGRREEKALVSTIRGLATSPTPALRRVAIAALGSIGESQDRALLAYAASDADPLVAAAAASASERLGPE